MRSLVLALAFFSSLLSSPLAAQGNVVPGTGCQGGLPAPWFQGSNRLGGTLEVFCNTPTASVQTLLLLGACAATPWPLPNAIACQAGCTVGIDPGLLIALDPRRGSTTLQIPNVPQLVGQSFCAQCVESIFGGCVTVSQAASVTIRP